MITRMLLLIASIALVSCASAPKMNKLGVGMSKAEVIDILGSPISAASPGGGVELLRYKLSESAYDSFDGNYVEYYTRFTDGKLDSYGKMGDFNSTKDPTYNINVKNR